ncbi:MAG: NAD-dependent epimerase/dehydratase family protein [Phycisphaeraceae bacterium]|nr:NAD-dependent epimerase/dehydratase family protein [Phycisphaeraceae bacterium]
MTNSPQAGQHSRRSFLRTTLAATALAATAGLSTRAMARRPGRAAGGMKILILGGTGFLGPACVEAAQARGHTLTLFNRGITEKRRGVVLPEVEKLVGDRDPDKGEGLKALEGRTWDAVIDTSSYVPRIARASARLLADNVGQYVLISTVSVYKRNDEIDQDETADVGTMADPTVEEMGAGFENYGPLKALCEKEAQEALPGRACIIRPGYIIGPGDPTPRFPYWPARLARGGEVLAPGTPRDPVQWIDVRDLGEWIIHCIEKKVMGTFNALGPSGGSDMAGFLGGIREGVGSKAEFTWVDAEYMEKERVGMLPIWVPPTGEYVGFHRRSCARAFAAGLKTRPISQTAKATLDWLDSLPEDRRARLVGAMTPEREAEVLAAYKKK